jgi:hypothetical protein
VFDLLTGERRADSQECRDRMQRHLAGCRSCRRLADAFEPAVELFRQCSATDDYAASLGISGPWDEPAEYDRPSPAPRPQTLPLLEQLVQFDWLRLALALLIGLTLGALVWGTRDPDDYRLAGPARLEMSAPQNRPARGVPQVSLASLKLTSSCLPEEHRPADHVDDATVRPIAELLAVVERSALACCTLCHAQLGKASQTKSATLEVIHSCQVCHTF